MSVFIITQKLDLLRDKIQPTKRNERSMSHAGYEGRAHFLRASEMRKISSEPVLIFPRGTALRLLWSHC